ncbi:MAG TPA: hypothetical protein VIQ60_05855 [Gemmatimonadaceae bacterium]
MRRSRASRSVAVLMTTMLAFQLWLTGSGMFCMVPGPAQQGMTRTMSGAMAMGSTPMATDQPTPGAAAASIPEQMPCDKQMSLPMCQAMGPCITALAAAAVKGNTERIAPTSRVHAMSVIAPPSQSFPPEPPPPRA